MKTSKTTGTKQILLATVHYEPRRTPHPITHFRKFSEELAKGIGLTVLRHEFQKYWPFGETVLSYLAESHICLESYEEFAKLEIEIVSCKEFDGSVLAEVAGKYDFTMSSVTVLKKGPEDQWRIE